MNQKTFTRSAFIFTSLMLIACVSLQTGIVATQTATRIIESPTTLPAASSQISERPYIPVPRWMILGQPGHGIEILGESWNYTDDRWGETHGCIDYTRENGPYVFFEQCFAIADETISFASQRDSFLNNDFDILTPKKTFGDVGQISLLGKRLEDNSKKFVKFFEIIGVEKYILLVEMNLVTDDDTPLQEIYESKAADTIDYVLQNGLEKSKLIPRPTATPLSPNQQNSYNDLAAKLITELEASTLYTATWMGEKEGGVDGTWEILGDNVGGERTQVCRIFEDRTNIDVRWVGFKNCIFATREFPFEDIADYYKKPGDTVLATSHETKSDFVMYGYNDGHTFFDAYLLDGEFIYHVSLESRTLTGETVEEVFNQTIDDFIYNVLMINAKN